MRHYLLGLAALLPICAHAQTAISPNFMLATPGQTIQFAATGSIAGWQVDNVNGGTASAGSITSAGLYTAPATLPNPAAVTITAIGTDGTQSTAVISLLAQLPAGSTYYVAPGGADTNPGTLAAPFATLQHAATIAHAGDTVLARAGTYNALFTPPNSGNTAQGPIIFASYPGETATIDGTGLAVPNGQNGLVTLSNLSNVIIEGFELRNYTTASTARVPIGLYIRGAGSNLQIINNHIHDISTTAATTPAKCGSDALGLAAYGSKAPASIYGLVVANNEIDHLTTGCSESMSIDGNVDTYLIASNRVHDNNNIGIDSIGYEKVSPNPAYDMARNGIVRGNLVYNITSYGNPDYGKQYAADGIYVDGGTNIIIEQNTVHNVDLGIELASEHKNRLTSYVTARNNLVYANNSNGISIGGYGPKRGGSDHIAIVNNTLYNNDTQATGSGEFQIQYYATNNIFENNIIQAGPQSLFVHSYTTSEPNPVQLDYNLYFASSGATAAPFTWAAKRITGFANYQAASGQDAHTLFIDPQLQAPPAGNLDLAPASPALNAGTPLGLSITGSADVAGNPRLTGSAISIGAYQQ